MKWPRALEGDPRLPQLEAFLAQNHRLLWAEGQLRVAHLPVGAEFSRVLMSLKGRHQLERGLEQIERTLASEKAGQEALRARQGTPAAQRLSRVLLMVDGGSERFYRHCERLLREHSDRVLGLRLDESGTALVEKLYGADALAKALLISHRDGVAQALWALLG